MNGTLSRLCPDTDIITQRIPDLVELGEHAVKSHGVLHCPSAGMAFYSGCLLQISPPALSPST